MALNTGNFGVKRWGKMEMQPEAQCFSVHSDRVGGVWLVGGRLHGLATWTWDMVHFQCFAGFCFLKTFGDLHSGSWHSL